MIEDILGIDINNIKPHHDNVMTELVNYNNELELNIQLFTEYDEVEGLNKIDYILNEQERLFTILGTTSALLFIYNRIEQFELSHELHKEMKKSFNLIMNEMFPNTNNDDKFHQLVEKMFDTFKAIVE